MDQIRFTQLWARNVSGEPPCAPAAVFDTLAELYAHPARRYHNGVHIDQCLLWLDRYADWVADPDAIELAIWFHDACYTPDPKGHEARGAKLFRRLTHGGMAEDRQDKISEMILHTTHCGTPESDEVALLMDIDLASFSRPWHQYVIDTAACRAERKYMDDVEFCLCQMEFLQAMLDRPTFYFSQPFLLHHEQQARDNIRRMLDLLRRRQQRLNQRSGC